MWENPFININAANCYENNRKNENKVNEWLSKEITIGQPGWLSGLAPPSAQGMILESHVGLPAWSLLLPLPLSLLSVLLINK